MTLRGVYNIHVVNCHTQQLENVIESKNSITFSGLADLFNSGNSNLFFTYWFKKITPSPFTTTMHVLNTNATMANTTTPIPSVTSIQIIPSSGGDPTYIQFAYRINPPSIGTSRTIYSFALAAASGASQTNMNNRAVARLDPPCTQTDSQFLDVYYRVYFDADGKLETYRQNFLSNLFTVTTGVFNGGVTGSVPMIVDKRDGALEDRFSVCSSELSTIATLSKGLHYNGNVPLWTETVAASSAVGRIYSTTMTTASSAPFNVYSEHPFTGFPKIGNVIPHGPASALKWFDVDNIATGSGNIAIEGDWNHNAAPGVPGRFYSSTFSTLYYLDVTGTGSATTGTYKYRKMPYFGAINGTYDAGAAVPALTCDGVNASLGGTIAEHTAERMSAIHRYDDTSVVLVKPGVITVYNIAAGATWFFDGSYTEPHQVAVLGDDIYVACRSTGLWRVNPKTETVATQITPPGIGLTQCYGVHLGFGGSLWVVATDCIAKWDGVSTWTRYDSGTSPAFNSTGISNGNYARVAYIKVDTSNADNRMVIIRRYDAPETSFGVWWSTVGTATNAWVDATSGNRSPRTNKNNIAVLNGVWFVDESNGLYQVSWGATVKGTSFLTTTTNHIFRCTPVLVGGVVYVLTAAPVVGAAGTFRYQITARNSTTTLTGPDVIIPSTGNTTLLDTTISGLGAYTSIREQTGVVQIQPGVILIWNRAPNASNRIVSALFNCTWSSNTTGPLHELNFHSYGWNGSAWVKDHAGSRTMHTTAEPLEKGMTVRFVNGVSGTSFNSGEFHTMVACDGVWKDNISTYTVRHTEYVLPTTPNCVDIESPIVTTSGTALSTGIVNADMNRTNTWVIQNPNNTFTFDCYNGGVYMIGDKKVAGNFEINITNTLSNNISIGICSRPGQIAAGFAWSTGSLYYSSSINLDINQGTPSGGMSASAMTGAVLKIIKSGTTLTLFKDATLLATHTMPTGQNEFYIYAKSGDRGADFNQSDMYSDTAPAITIISNGSSTGIKLGNIANNTGVYNPKFYRICNRAPLMFKLDGVTVATVKTDRTAPNPGEVSVDLDQGIAYCNAADVGKTLTGVFTPIYLQ